MTSLCTRIELWEAFTVALLAILIKTSDEMLKLSHALDIHLSFPDIRPFSSSSRFLLLLWLVISLYEAIQLIIGARFLPAVSRENRGPLFLKIRKTQSVTQPLPISDILHMCSDCLALPGSLPYDCFLLNSLFKLWSLVSSRWRQSCCQPSCLPALPSASKRQHSNLPEDLHAPPMLLKATRGFPHGNFYTSWQVARTPGLRKTPNDDWERVRSTLKTCWVANIGVCRKAGSARGGEQKKESVFGGRECSLNRWLRCLMGLAKVWTTPLFR